MGCAVYFAPQPFFPVYLCVNVGLRGLLAVALPALFIPQSASLWVHLCCRSPVHPSCPGYLSLPPLTGRDECFFFISLVVRLPYGSIFCQFWLFFVFKLLFSFFWLCEEAQCVYLHLHLGSQLHSNPPSVLEFLCMTHCNSTVSNLPAGASQLGDF